MNKDAEQQLIEEAQANDASLEEQDWWVPGKPWHYQDQTKLRAWHDEQTKNFKRGW